ncbi:Amidohydrolase family protein [Shewanella piezotolerans WP3]|uniref:Amidohydrolase family protein n=1 Tax=Shewanella piezotolerans (strain WP3 / JCM 13877) TaxID=225849 RepID=B8CLU3_SHEPW|nr:amidohydrolase family protein [Shewanella piezotolerans]ACJ28867.1 Amidohydrolase family protein [Shewanella piezotolerans WP3]
MKQLSLVASLLCVSLSSIAVEPQEVDLLISGKRVHIGDGSAQRALDIAICGDKICGISPLGEVKYVAKQRIDAKNSVVSPGFIDPHTHSIEQLLSEDKKANLNYLYQGVTTVVNGNDGDGRADIQRLSMQLTKNGIGTNTALLAGHGYIRRAVMGLAERYATKAEIAQMQMLLTQAMEQGAVGLSSGLYYVPGVYADAEEVIALAKVAAKYDGIYDTHLRDESTFNIGFTAAIEEAIKITNAADIHLHIAHIKALGKDVWGQSKDVIKLINAAQQSGSSISADQYPWRASGTNLKSAVVPKWVMADSRSHFLSRLEDPSKRAQIISEIEENIRRRGGPDSLLITAAEDESLEGETLKEIAAKYQKTAAETVLELVKGSRIRVASFNMSPADIERFMVQPWVVTSSDGTDGHPRKYASFPKKYREYVQQKSLLTLPQFIQQSSSKTAAILKLDKRGLLQTGYFADIVIFDSERLRDEADFAHWNRLSSGVDYVVINGKLAINQGQYTGLLGGRVVK